MSVPHSSTPWSVSQYSATTIKDVHGAAIAEVCGSNEQSSATAAHIVRCVNEWAEGHADAENERHAADR